MTRGRSAAIYQIGILPVLLAAFVLRTYRLDAQSLWYDEGNSVVMAARGIEQIVVHTAADIHPPLYYVLLRWWSHLAGTTEFSVRFLSVVFGVLAVAAVIAIGRRLSGQAVAAVAGALAAGSPFLVYYSQEARMYAQLCALAALSTYIFLVLLAPRERMPGRTATLLVAYILLTTAALYTHYFALSVLVAQLALALAVVRRQDLRSAVARLVLAQSVAGLLYAPWLPALWGQLESWSTSATPMSAAHILQDLFVVFSFGPSWDATATAKSQMFTAGLLAVGIAAALRPAALRGRAARPAPADLLLLVVPVLIVLGLEIRKPTYQPKLVIASAAAYELLLALGIVTLSALAGGLVRWAGSRGWNARYAGRTGSGTQPALSEHTRLFAMSAMAVLLLAIVGFFDVRSLAAYYLDPKYGRDDYRGLAQFITANERTGDAIVLNAPNQIEVLDYYYRGRSARYPLPWTRPLDPAATADDLAQVVTVHPRIWVVEWAARESDPEGFVEDWLSRRLRGTEKGHFGRVRLVLYQNE